MSLDRQTQTGDSFSPLGRQRWRIIQQTNRDNGRLRKREVEHSNLDSLLVLDPMGKCYHYVTGALLLVTEFIINPFRLISMNQNDKKDFNLGFLGPRHPSFCSLHCLQEKLEFYWIYADLINPNECCSS